MAVVTLPMYQGEDWSQQLSFFTDQAMTTPQDFANPVMDLRNQQGVRVATFDDIGKEGLAVVSDLGELTLTMSYINTALVPAATYQIDIFADLDGERKAIVKRGTIQLVVTARITQDDIPVEL